MRFVLSVLIGVWGMCASSGATDTYIGCGTVAAAVICEGCGPGDGSCECKAGNCVQGNYACLIASPAFVQCGTGGSCYNVYTRTYYCVYRKKCNNSLGEEGGSCISTCYESDEYLTEGTRTDYYTTTPC